MAGNLRISALIAGPLYAVALVASAHAQESLFDRPTTAAVAAPKAEDLAPAQPKAKPVVEPKPKHIVKHKTIPKPVNEPAAAQAPVAPVAQEPAPEPQSAFGQQMPRQSLINRFTNPERPAAPAVAGAPQGAAAPAEPVEETQPNGMPSKYLLNRLFNSSALEPAHAQPDARSFMAQAPAQPEPAQPSWFDQATGALGFGKKDQSTDLPPVNVTAPAARPNPAPVPPSAAVPPAPAAPSQPGWFDGAKNAIGLGNETAPIPDYSERPKLTVPANREALPQPNAVDERKVPRPVSAEALTKPPAGYLDKVQGADGKVSGFTKEDEGKNRKFLNFF